MSTLDKKYYHNIDLDSNELKAGRVYNLTTTQRTGLSLNTTHKGYIVYDTTALSLFIWNGTAWTTAAGGSGTVSSVAALTLGTTGTDLSSTVVNGSTTPVITLNVPTASATNRGVLSSADWTNFNTAYTNRITSLTTTGSGAATLVSNVLNIPTPPIISYVHTQEIASTSWVITHNLNFYPNVTVINSTGANIVGDITYTSTTSVTLTFSAAVSGTAYLS